MNQDPHLKLQAYLDGELSRREARKLEAWIAAEPQARQLLEALRSARALLRENEPERALPESRAFYWSKIQRAIEQREPDPAPPAWLVALAALAAWRRYLAPLAGVAFMAFLVLGLVRFYGPGEEFTQHLAEVENLSEHVGSFSFRTHSDNMFVVWLYDKNQTAPADPEMIEEEAVQ